MRQENELEDTLPSLTGSQRTQPASSIPDDALSRPLQPVLRPAPWSKSEVLDRLGDDEDLLRELCGIFLGESAKLLEKLRQAIAGGEAEAVMRAAHSLKGEVSYLSAPAATEAAGWLEDMGHNHDISRAAEALVVVEREMEYLCRAIREFAGVEP
jgi:HPt (histidine-containing phosphotransfer) domain-containing protein